MIKGIVFDFDGVILETAEVKTNAFKRLFQNHPDKLEEIVEYHRENMGISRFVKFRHIHEHILKSPFTDDAEEVLGEQFRSLVFDEVVSAPFVPGALEFLRDYQNRYLFFVASGTPEGELLEIAEKRQLSSYFKEWHGSPKEKHEILSDILKRHRFNASEILMVGDNLERDVKGAKALGMKTALAKYGQVLNLDSKEKADFELEKFSDILGIL